MVASRIPDQCTRSELLLRKVIRECSSAKLLGWNSSPPLNDSILQDMFGDMFRQLHSRFCAESLQFSSPADTACWNGTHVGSYSRELTYFVEVSCTALPIREIIVVYSPHSTNQRDYCSLQPALYQSERFYCSPFSTHYNTCLSYYLYLCAPSRAQICRSSTVID